MEISFSMRNFSSDDEIFFKVRISLRNENVPSSIVLSSQAELRRIFKNSFPANGSFGRYICRTEGCVQDLAKASVSQSAKSLKFPFAIREVYPLESKISFFEENLP